MDVCHMTQRQEGHCHLLVNTSAYRSNHSKFGCYKYPDYRGEDKDIYVCHMTQLW